MGRRCPPRTSPRSLFDLLCLLGLALVGRRFGGPRLAATLAFAWAAYPFTQYASNSNTNDAIMPALPDLGLLARARRLGARRFRRARRLDEVRARSCSRRCGLTYPDGCAAAGRARSSRSASRVATLVAFSVLLLEPTPLHAARVFWRSHDRLPDRPRVAVLALGLGPVPRGRHPRPAPRPAGARGAARRRRARASAFVPRRKSPLQLAALTAALLIGFELVLTHWFYLYIPWFFPFVAFALLCRGRRSRP